MRGRGAKVHGRFFKCKKARLYTKVFKTKTHESALPSPIWGGAGGEVKKKKDELKILL